MKALDLQDIRRRLVAAHRAQDWDLARKLSQLKERAKKRPTCAICQVPITPGAIHCSMHWRIAAHKVKRLAPLVLLVGCQATPPPPRPLLSAPPVRPAHYYRLEGRIIPPAPAPFISSSMLTPTNDPAKHPLP